LPTGIRRKSVGVRGIAVGRREGKIFESKIKKPY